MATTEKLTQMLEGLAVFAILVGAVLVFAGRTPRADRSDDRRVAIAFLAPAILGLLIVVVYPALRTIYQSTFDADGSDFIGFGNYSTIFTTPDQIVVLRNTALWVILSPLAATSLGLLYAVLVDRARFESFAKALIFMPMAISFVGASIIWKFIYEYRPDFDGVNQIGLLNQVLVWLGGTPQQWLIRSPWNSLFLIAVMVWVQAGFAMTILSAAIKGIPAELVEAARVDGATGKQVFRRVTLPLVRPAIIVVLTTVAIWTLKVFDIIRTMTGGQFDTSVVANEFYTQTFRSFDQGVGSALAVLLFVLVLPVILYNVRQIRRLA